MSPITRQGPPTVPDLAAIVAASAVAGAHLQPFRGVVSTPAGMVGAALVFAWLALSAAGPFLWFSRRARAGRRRRTRLGERLWTLTGAPWVLSAVIRSAAPAGDAGWSGTGSMVLAVGLAVSSTIAMLTLWRRWVAVSPSRAARLWRGPWPHRVGLALALAWPVQCALGLVILS